jgi:riboflavin kinase
MLRDKIILNGKVISGLGVGAKYVRLYRRVFEKYLGLDPYPGTLNVDVGRDVSSILAGVPAKIIPPPLPDYAAVIAYKASIGGVRVYVIKPCITKYDWSILEIISEYNLRRRFNLHDGSEISIIIEEY